MTCCSRCGTTTTRRWRGSPGPTWGRRSTGRRLVRRHRPRQRRACARRRGRGRRRASEISFDAMAARSDRVGRWLLGLGVGAGRPGAAHARQPGRALGRHARGDEARRGHRADDDRRRARRPRRPDGPRRGPRRRHQPRPDREVRRLVPGDYVRVSVGRRPTAGPTCTTRTTIDVEPLAAPGHRARRPAAALLHLRHHQPAQARRAHPGVLPRRPPLDDVLARPAARRPCTSTSPSPGWAKHAWSCFFAPWIAEATVVVLSTTRASTPAALLDVLRDARGHHASAPRRRCGGCSSTPTCPAARARCARWSAPASRSTPRSSSRCGALGPDLRDGYGQTEMTAAVGNTPGSAAQARLDGPAAARGARSCSSTRSPAQRVDGPGEGEICLDLVARTRCR